LAEYNKYKANFKNNWNLKSEVIKYCNLDCISLYQILFKFNDMIFSLFGKNIHHYPTLPSLAFAIFRSNFMDEENIPQLSGKIANDIRSGYTGGAVDMYIPEPPKGVKIKSLDVNSLYPSQMATQKCL
jgi:DNA polymerase type B, organellar and viral